MSIWQYLLAIMRDVVAILSSAAEAQAKKSLFHELMIVLSIRM
jgi:hypothetical protein